MEEEEEGIQNKGSSLIKDISKVTYNVIIAGNLGMYKLIVGIKIKQ